MNKEKHGKAKKTFESVGLLLEDENLSPESRRQFEQLRAQLAAVTMSSWFPSDWPRRISMLIFFLVGVWGFIRIDFYFLFLILLSLFFSPRLVAKTAIIIGKLLGNK